ncbi:SIS domain-containing protein [Uniformispora flossi]|uniref:SIS domain-containing protein n=1 Tax=Uniformispora flossi TaxID=3390723 RepID=UPI003C2C4791
MTAAVPEAGSGAVRGAVMTREIAEQPAVLARILERGLPDIRAAAEAIRAAQPRFVVFAARGTSDNASLYAKYLVEILLGLPAGLASMSTMTTYGARPRLHGTLFVTVSQSGGSPDLIESTRAAREAGALTLAVTNNPDSALASAADLHLDVLAGPELALPATKTYTAELLTLYLLVDAVRGGTGDFARGIPSAAAEVLARGGEVRDHAREYRFADRLVLTSRGYGYPTVREAALKVMETSYLHAQAFSGADLLHGPLAMIDGDAPVIAVVPDGAGGRALAPVLDRLRAAGARTALLGPPDGFFPLPVRLCEEVQPIVQILPLQTLACEIALDRNLDPDAPRALAKVTRTR